jgi:peroxiredoxin
LRDEYESIRERGAEVVAIGTGDAAAAGAFVEDEQIPYPVLADPKGVAARAASIESASALGLFHPASYAGAARAYRAGHRIGMAGKRVTQLGSTFVVGPGPVVHYTHRDAHTADHAPLTEILAALA